MLKRKAFLSRLLDEWLTEYLSESYWESTEPSHEDFILWISLGGAL